MYQEGVLWCLLIAARISALPTITEPQWPLPNTQPLRFTENGIFQISIFEDLHYGEGWSDPLDDGFVVMDPC
jgi:hypothetical protein